MEASLAVVLISPLSQQDLTTQDTSRLIGFRIDLCERVTLQQGQGHHKGITRHGTTCSYPRGERPTRVTAIVTSER